MCVLADKSSCEIQAAPPGVRWLSIDVVAAKLGITKQHACEICRNKWAGSGLAKQMPNSHGGKPHWEVRQDADDRLASVQWPEQIPFDQTGLNQDQRDELGFLHKLVTDWYRAPLAYGKTIEKAKENYLEKILLEHGRRMDGRTLDRLVKDYRRDGMKGLFDGRWKSSNSTHSAPEFGDFYQYLKEIYLNTRQLNVRKCYEIAKAKCVEDGSEYPEEHTARRYLKKLPPQLVIKMRKGESAFVAQCEPYIQRDYSELASNDVWCGDHHRFDVMIRHGNTADGKPKFVRPWLTAWQDVRSRKIVGWCIFVTDPNTDTILEAFTAGCKSHGIPKAVQIDNGKDFDSRALQGITKRQRRSGQFTADNRCVGAFNILGVGVQHVWPYHGQSKPIERFFGTVCERFSKMWETSCGNAPTTKPENLPRQLELGKAPTLEEFRQAFGEWLEADYHGRVHLGNAMDGQTPAAAFDACLESKRTLPEETLIFACMPRTKPVKIGRHGVTYQGLHFGATNEEVIKRFGQKVMLAIDNNDLRRVLVVDLEGRLICRADGNLRASFKAKSEDLSAAIAEKKKTRKIKGEYFQRRTRLAQGTHDLLQRTTAQRIAVEQSPAPMPPPAMQMVQTSIETPPEEIREALESPMSIAPAPERSSRFTYSSTAASDSEQDARFTYSAVGEL